MLLVLLSLAAKNAREKEEEEMVGVMEEAIRSESFKRFFCCPNERAWFAFAKALARRQSRRTLDAPR